MAARTHASPAPSPSTPLRKGTVGRQPADMPGSLDYVPKTGAGRKIGSEPESAAWSAPSGRVQFGADARRPFVSKMHQSLAKGTVEDVQYQVVPFPESDLKMLVPDSFALKEPGVQRRELKRLVKGVQEIASKPVPVNRDETADATKAKVLPGWKKLLEKSLQGQARTLQSDEFLSVAQAAPLLGVEDAAVRRRIREGKLLALKHPSGGEHRVPIWATGISSGDTKALTDLGGDSPWDLYQFMEAPHGAMKALRPCDLLVAPEHLPAATRGARDTLAASLKANGSTLLGLVLQALKEHVSREA